MAAILPVSLMAEDSGIAILHHKGGVLLNGNPAPLSSALFPGDLVQTPSNAETTINASGYSVTVKAETLVRLEGEELVLDHGMLLVSTSRGLRVRVGCLLAVPASAAWTQYEVTDSDRKITVAARKSDMNIESRGIRTQPAQPMGYFQRVTLREGEQTTREEGCAATPKPPTYVAAKGAILNSPWVKWPAATTVAGLTCWGLCRDDDPISPYVP
jgi:hypothetical protein